MAEPRVLRFNRSDDESAFVLLQVTSSGARPLDVKLIATEGEAPYVASLKNDKVASLRVKGCSASEEEWYNILSSLLSQEHLSDIRATAAVQSGASISITIRKDIQGITQRLGSITLKHDADEEIELFEWCGAAANAASRSNEALANAAEKAQQSNDMIQELQSQLEELILAKEQDEAALLHKFRDLLNEKKVKIREQHKLLATAAFPQETQAEEAEPPSLEPEKKRKPGKSRSIKRKAQAAIVEESSDEEEGERMDVDEPEIKREEQETESDRETEATASISSDVDDDAADDKDSEQVTNGLRARREVKPSEEAPKKKTEQPPPKRDLPFGNRKPVKAAAKAAPAAPANADSETESDDEL